MISYSRLKAKVLLKPEDLKVKVPYTLHWPPRMDMPTKSLVVYGDPYKKTKIITTINSNQCFMLVNPPINVFDYRFEQEITNYFYGVQDTPLNKLKVEMEIGRFQEQNKHEKLLYSLHIIGGTDALGYLHPHATERFYEASPEDDDDDPNQLPDSVT